MHYLTDSIFYNDLILQTNQRTNPLGEESHPTQCGILNTVTPFKG